MAAEETKVELVEEPTVELQEENVIKDPLILVEYNRILQAFSEVGISVGFFSSFKEDGVYVQYQVNPFEPLTAVNSGVIIRLYVNGTEIGECNGERAGLYIRRVFLDAEHFCLRLQP